MDHLQNQLSQISKNANLKQDIVEKDYILSYLLAGIATQPGLANTLIFKGGTALKKFYFGSYRFSEDLDFSETGAPKKKALENLIRRAAGEAERMLNSRHGSFLLTVERYEEKSPHPRDQEAFTVRAKFPWQREPFCRVKIEIYRGETVLLQPDGREMIHGYGESLPVQMRCYRLEEIVAEKMMATLETHQKLATRGWCKPRVRDYYDLWRIFDEYGSLLERGELPQILGQKSLNRGITFKSLDDFFTKELVSEAHAHWEGVVGNLTSDLPPCDRVLEDLKAKIPDFFPNLAR